MKYNYNPAPPTKGDLDIWLKSDFLREAIKRHANEDITGSQLPNTGENYIERIDFANIKLPNTVEEYQELLIECMQQMRIEDYLKITWYYEHAVVVSV